MFEFFSAALPNKRRSSSIYSRRERDSIGKERERGERERGVLGLHYIMMVTNELPTLNISIAKTW